jgi:hypothetical protein
MYTKCDKKISPIILSLVGLITFLFTSIVYAENSTSTTLIENEESIETNEEIENQSTTTASSTETTSTTTEITPPVIEETKPTKTKDIYLSETKQKRITNLCANISNRLDAVIARQDNIANRLNSRITKMKEQNFDTTVAEANLVTAKATLATAKDKMRNIDMLVNQTITSTNINSNWQITHTTYLETESLVKKTQDELRLVVSSLKVASPNEQNFATTSEDNIEE